jgi:hypothetical protein
MGVQGMEALQKMVWNAATGAHGKKPKSGHGEPG